MKIPCETPVMTLPNATLFPQALLPLYIFEPRYRKMLADALQSDRMIAVAMQRPGELREKPFTVAGLGLIRVSVGHRDGTSHLILQGVARVGLGKVVRYKPYRVQRIRPLQTPPCDSAAADALLVKVRALVAEWIKLGMPFPFPMSPQPADSTPPPPTFSAGQVADYLDSIADPDQVADLVSCAVLPGAAERQAILEALSVETRLQRLVEFLLAEIRKEREHNRHE